MEELKTKAKYFEEEAFEAFKNKRFTLVVFFVEQAIQLYLKYLLFKKVGEYPKTHNLRILFNEASKIINLKNFIQENEEIIDLLQTSYIEARYTPTEFSKKSAKIALEFLKKFKKVLKNEI
ncbi:MAG: HEPN domain-containing protein [Candidatus Aenigmatarchaeota archaeon]